MRQFCAGFENVRIIISYLAIALSISLPALAEAQTENHETDSDYSVLVHNADITLRPYPKEWRPHEGKWLMLATIELAIQGDEDPFPAQHLAEKLTKRYGVKVERIAGNQASDADIVLTYTDSDAVRSDEGFIFDVTPSGIHLQARAGTGMYYGVRALLQLIHLSSIEGGRARAAAVHCEDWPTVPRRIVLHAVGPMNRPLNVQAYKDFIYDEIAGGRYDTMILISRWSFPFESHPEVGPSTRPGVQWTKAQWREVLAFAERHYVQVNPGLEMPGHAQYLIRPFPDLGYPDNPNVLDVSNPKAIELVKDLCSELIEFYEPFAPKFFHLTGDEVIFANPKPEKAAERRRELLEFWREMGTFVKARGLRPVIYNDMVSFNGGEPYHMRRILPEIPRDFVINQWVSFPVWPGDNQPLGHTVNPVSEYRELGFDTMWRVLTAFYRGNVNQAVNWETAWDGVGIALFVARPWTTFSYIGVPTLMNYTNGLLLVSQVTWNPKPVSIYGAKRMNRELGPSWVATMQVPAWGVHSMGYRPLAMSSEGSAKQTPAVPPLILPENGLLFVGVGKVPFHAGIESRRSVGPGETAQPVQIGKRVRGLMFLHTSAAAERSKKGVKALRDWFLDHYNSSYAMNVAFYQVRYADGEELKVPVKLGWNTHLWHNIYFRTRLMPGISGYWIGFHESKTKGAKPPEPFDPDKYENWFEWSKPAPDVTLFAMPWVNPRPDVPITSVTLEAAKAPAQTVLFGVTAVVEEN